MRAALAQRIGSAILGFVISLATSLVPVYTGADDQAIGPSTWSGLPIPFHQGAPGGRIFGWWYHTFWLDVAFWTCLVYWLLVRGSNRRQPIESQRK